VIELKLNILSTGFKDTDFVGLTLRTDSVRLLFLSIKEKGRILGDGTWL